MMPNSVPIMIYHVFPRQKKIENVYFFQKLFIYTYFRKVKKRLAGYQNRKFVQVVTQ